MRYTIAEYGEKYAEPLISEYALRKAFWWEGEWRGKGVYLRPEIKLIDDWIKVAHRGDDGS